MLLIIGIDPGTTSGITALDLRGRLVASISRKGLGQAGIVRTIERLGTPILISTDKSPVPQKVVKVAAAFSARLICSTHPLTRSEKLDMFKRYFKKCGLAVPAWDRHRKDSLAAALFAWKAHRAIISKIDKRIERYRNRPYFDMLERHVQSEVLLRDQNLDHAIKSFFKKYQYV